MSAAGGVNETQVIHRITLNEFRSWLEGVEEMQGPDWTPNLEQWKKIRVKIALLLEDKNEDIETIVRRACENSFRLLSLNANNYSPAPLPPIRQFVPPDGPGVNNVPPGGSDLDSAPAHITTIMPSGSGSTKTPNIDTSNGVYTPPYV